VWGRDPRLPGQVYFLQKSGEVQCIDVKLEKLIYQLLNEYFVFYENK
jgi:hypothetical protein